MKPHPSLQRILTPRQLRALANNKRVHREGWQQSVQEMTRTQREDMQREEPPNANKPRTMQAYGK